jgi:hypothetical protein
LVGDFPNGGGQYRRSAKEILGISDKTGKNNELEL